MLQATVPKGAGPGDHIPVIHPDTGVHYTVTVPAGFSAGQTFHFTTEPIALAQPLPAPPAPVLQLAYGYLWLFIARSCTYRYRESRRPARQAHALRGLGWGSVHSVVVFLAQWAAVVASTDCMGPFLVAWHVEATIIG